MTEDKESDVVERQMSLVEDNGIRKRPWVKALGHGTFWEHSLWAVGSHRAQRANILGLIFTPYLLRTY